MVGTQIASRLYRRVGPRRLVAAGQFTVAVVLITLSFVMSRSIPRVVPMLLMFVLGTGQAHTFMPTQASAFDTVTPEYTGATSALYNATRQVGSAVGVASPPQSSPPSASARPRQPRFLRSGGR